MRYILHESEHPISTDYFYQCTKTTNDHFPKLFAHTHDFYEIYFFLSGSVKLFVEDKIYMIKKGDVLVIPPYTIHQLLPIGDLNMPYDRIYMYITDACLASFQFNEHSLLQPIEMAIKAKRYHFTISDSADFERIFQAMYLMHRSNKEDYYGKEMLNRSRILEIMTLINKHILLDMAPRKTTHANPIVDQVLAFINEHYMESLTLDDIANHFYINKFTLTKLFKEQTALTLHNYILMKRISMAKQKMTEGIHPSAVYLDVGFNDYSTFYRAFQKLEKMSPKDFATFAMQTDHE
nr:helix-turn-helix domain-containing protein [Eubacterium sp.]